MESNHLPIAYKAIALTDELQAQFIFASNKEIG